MKKLFLNSLKLLEEIFYFIYLFKFFCAFCLKIKQFGLLTLPSHNFGRKKFKYHTYFMLMTFLQFLLLFFCFVCIRLNL